MVLLISICRATRPPEAIGSAMYERDRGSTDELEPSAKTNSDTTRSLLYGRGRRCRTREARPRTGQGRRQRPRWWPLYGFPLTRPNSLLWPCRSRGKVPRHDDRDGRRPGRGTDACARTGDDRDNAGQIGGRRSRCHDWTGIDDCTRRVTDIARWISGTGRRGECRGDHRCRPRGRPTALIRNRDGTKRA